MKSSLPVRFLRDRRANVVVIYAICMPIIAFAVGLAIDFGRAAQLRTHLNGAADAAALAALTPAMMAQSNTTAQAAAVSMFNGQAASIAGLAAADTTVTATVTNPNNNTLIRTATVCYGAAEQTIFAGILNTATIGLGNCSSATIKMPPNIDFYLLLDNSPSMALPATQTGISQLENLTLAQMTGGCAFACHLAVTNTTQTEGNTCANGTAPTVSGGLYCAASQGAQLDDYQMARNAGITLRLDVLSSAVTTLMDTAQTNSNSSPFSPPPAYRFAVNSMDSLWQIGFTNLMSLTSNYVSGWTSASANFGVMEMYDNNSVCTTSACTAGDHIGDVTTNYDNALSGINSQMPNPGNGTNVSGDKPQEVLFFVTDGVEDEESGGNRLVQEINAGNSTNYCTQIKARGIKIAILYTEYLPVPLSPFWVSDVESFQNDIGPALEACASPGLFYDAAVGADLGVALTTLFQTAVQSANLTQ